MKLCIGLVFAVTVGGFVAGQMMDIVANILAIFNAVGI